MKKVFKKMVSLLLAVMMIGSILVGSVSAAEVQVAGRAAATEPEDGIVGISDCYYPCYDNGPIIGV